MNIHQINETLHTTVEMIIILRSNLKQQLYVDIIDYTSYRDNATTSQNAPKPVGRMQIRLCQCLQNM
jgi:hypothetical protein